ncbi:AraC family transcriptional regulator [Cricetibacter osteomyelitidis]|uniref:AraC family transcriptional regulator n=1 Tax=Cricetibacter osteomyelitidis TaxID=1521931 RepID=A0A4R2T730_9PAST|nr:AraC family transcriptional regulator [Cricetibacter osteomyelitidis]TCP97306.1 AraC family transcriptional regulator [Cricetibacter osteomyelitidis]
MSEKIILPPMDFPIQLSESYPVKVIFRRHIAQNHVCQHSHPWAQLIFTEQGVVRIWSENTVFTLPPHYAVYIPANTPHSVDIIESADLYVVCLSALNESLRCYSIFVRPLLKALLMSLTQEQHHNDEYYALTMPLILYEIRYAPQFSLGIMMPKDKRLYHCCEKLLKQPDLQQTLADLTLQAGASISTLQRLFKRELHCSFSTWRKQALLSQAIVLFEKGESLSQIALALGYKGQSAFSYMFRQLLGMPPRQFFTWRIQENKK